MTLDEARALVNGPLWTKVRDDFLTSGSFSVFPRGDARRLRYLESSVRDEIALWLKALPQLSAWRTTVDGKVVRQLKAEYPGVYPQALQYALYFPAGLSEEKVLERLLKLKFPEAHRLVYEL